MLNQLPTLSCVCNHSASPKVSLVPLAAQKDVLCLILGALSVPTASQIILSDTEYIHAYLSEKAG